MNPNDARVHRNLAGALTLAGMDDRAVIEYVEAIRLKPDYTEARSRLATVLIKLKRIDDAIAQLREVVRLRPDSAEAQDDLAKAERQRNKGQSPP